MELSEDTPGFIVLVPQPDHAPTTVVKDYFRCRIEDEELEQYAVLVYSDVVRCSLHTIVWAVVLLVTLHFVCSNTCPSRPRGLAPGSLHRSTCAADYSSALLCLAPDYATDGSLRPQIFSATRARSEPVIVPGLGPADGAAPLRGGQTPASAGAMVTQVAEIMRRRREAGASSSTQAAGKKTR